MAHDTQSDDFGEGPKPAESEELDAFLTGAMMGMVSAMGVPPDILAGGISPFMPVERMEQHRKVINVARKQGKKNMAEWINEAHYRGDVEMTGEQPDEET